MKYVFYVGFLALVLSLIFFQYEPEVVAIIKTNKNTAEGNKKKNIGPAQLGTPTSQTLEPVTDIGSGINSGSNSSAQRPAIDSHAFTSPAIKSGMPVTVERDNTISYEEAMSLAIESEQPADAVYDNSNTIGTAAIESDTPVSEISASTKGVIFMPAVESDMPVSTESDTGKKIYLLPAIEPENPVGIDKTF